MFPQSSHQSSSEENLAAERTGMIWRRSELDTGKIWATSNSHRHGGTQDTSCPCALCSLAEEKEMPQCCHEITCAGHAATLAETGYQADVLLARKSKVAGQRGTEKCETKLPGHCRAPEWPQEKSQVSTQIWGQALIHPGPLSPGPSLYSFHQCCVELTLNIWNTFCLFFSASVEHRRESSSRHCSRGINGHISWKGSAEPGCVKPHPGCPLICCYMKWKIWKHISG